MLGSMVHFGVILAHVGIILVHFGIIWGAKLEPKVGLEAPGGLPGSPKGSQGAPWEPKGAILVDLGVIWVHFGIIWGAKLVPKVGLEAPGGPPGSPKGSQGVPWKPKGAILVDFGVILGTFLKSKSYQNRCQKSSFFRVWILSDFGVFRGAYL